MAMHQGFDLSRFKKVSSDAKSTTMRHANGHEVKIVHSALSPAMRAQVDSLPSHQEPIKMAKGGVVKKMADGGETAPASADDLPPGADLSAVNAANRPAGIPPPPDSAPSTDQGPEAIAPPSPTPSAPSPDSDNTINVIGQRPPAPTMQSLTAEQQAWQNDLSNGHITPETYQSLYAKKDTLGKIGTIFGLLVGGAPSNNMAFQMMDRQIHNDMQAQIQSKSNAVNYYNAATNMAQGMANADQIAANTGLVNARLGVWQSLNDNVSKMPPGPGQQRAQTLLQQMFPAMQAQNMQDNSRAIIAAHRGGKAEFNGPVNDQLIGSLGLVGMPGINTGAMTGESGSLNQLRGDWGNYKDGFHRLEGLNLAGQGPDVAGAAADLLGQVGSMAPSQAMQVLGRTAGAVGDMARRFYTERQAIMAQAPNVDPALWPSAYDLISPTARAQRMTSAARAFDTKERASTTNLRQAESMGFNVMKPAP